MYRLGRSQFIPFVATVLGVVFTDLLKGIAIGMVFAIFYILRNNYKHPFYVIENKHVSGKELAYNIVLAEVGNMLKQKTFRWM